MDGGSWRYSGDSDQDHLHEKEMQKGKQLSEEALQITEGKKKKWKEKEKGKDIPNWMQSSRE